MSKLKMKPSAYMQAFYQFAGNCCAVALMVIFVTYFVTPAASQKHQAGASYFSKDPYVCVARNFTADQKSLQLDAPKKTVSCVDIFCYEGRRHAVLNAFAKIRFLFTFPHQRSPKFKMYHGTYNEIMLAFARQKGSAWSFTSVLPSIPVWKLFNIAALFEGLWWWPLSSSDTRESYQVSPFETSCVGIDSLQGYVLTFSNQVVNIPLVTGFFGAVFLWLYANRLAPNHSFQYVGGTGTGMLLFVILIAVYISRRVPKRAYALSGFLSIFSASIFAYGYNAISSFIRTLATHHPLLVVTYFIITGFISFLIIWWYGPITNPRSVKAFGIALRGLSVLMLLWCSNVPELAVVTIVLLALNDGRKFVLEVPLFNRLWLRMQGWLGIQTTSRDGLISPAEFEIEAQVETARALAELKEQMASGEWKKYKNRIRDSHKLANFVFGNDDHVSLAEKDAHNELMVMADQFYEDEPPEDSDIDDNVGGNDDPDSGDLSLNASSSSNQSPSGFNRGQPFVPPPRRAMNVPPSFGGQHFSSTPNRPLPPDTGGLYPPLDNLRRNFDFVNQDTPPMPRGIAQHQQQQHARRHYAAHRDAFMQNAAASNAGRNAFNVPTTIGGGAKLNGLNSAASSSRPIFGQRQIPSAPVNGNADDDDDDDDNADAVPSSSRVQTFAAHYGPSNSAIPPMRRNINSPHISPTGSSHVQDNSSSGYNTRKRRF